MEKWGCQGEAAICIGRAGGSDRWRIFRNTAAKSLLLNSPDSRVPERPGPLQSNWCSVGGSNTSCCFRNTIIPGGSSHSVYFEQQQEEKQQLCKEAMNKSFKQMFVHNSETKLFVTGMFMCYNLSEGLLSHSICFLLVLCCQVSVIMVVLFLFYI